MVRSSLYMIFFRIFTTFGAGIRIFGLSMISCGISSVQILFFKLVIVSSGLWKPLECIGHVKLVFGGFFIGNLLGEIEVYSVSVMDCPLLCMWD